MSAMAPAASDSSMIGSIRAVWTSATMPADDVIWVIDQAAPTPLIIRPRLVSRLAVQIRRNTACRSGAVIPSADSRDRLAGLSVVVLTGIL